MPASSALINEAERSANPEQVLKNAYDRGEYQEYSNSPDTIMRNGRPRKKIKGFSVAQRYASYRSNGSGVQTSKLYGTASPAAPRTPDPDMVTTASGGQVVKSVYDEQQAQTQKMAKKKARLARTQGIGSSDMGARPAHQKTMARHSMPEAKSSPLDNIVGAKAEPKPPMAAAANPAPQPARLQNARRSPRPEATFDGKSKAEFFGEAAQRQKQNNAFSKYTAPEKSEESKPSIGSSAMAAPLEHQKTTEKAEERRVEAQTKPEVHASPKPGAPAPSRLARPASIGSSAMAAPPAHQNTTAKHDNMTPEGRKAIMDDAMNDRGDFAKKPEPTPQRKTTPISYNDVAQKQKDMDAAYKPAAGKAVQYGVGAATEAAKMIGRGVGAAASGVSSSVDEMFTGSQKSKDKFKKSRLARI